MIAWAQTIERNLMFIKTLFAKNKDVNSKPSAHTLAESIAIDVSDEMKEIKLFLEKQWKELCRYPEFLALDEKDKLPILEYIWNKWAYHGSGIEKHLLKVYPQYPEKDIRLIVLKEHSRMKKYLDMQKYQKSGLVHFMAYNPKSKPEEKIDSNKKYSNSIYLCFIEDMPKIDDVWYNSDEYIKRSHFTPLTENTRGTRYVKEVYLYQNGENVKMSKDEFKSLCQERNIVYPLWVSPKEREERKHKMWQQRMKKALKDRGIHFDENQEIDTETFKQLTKTKEGLYNE